MQRGGGKRRSDPEGLGDILKREIRPKVRRRRRDEDRARHKWTKVIGEELASRTWVMSFRRKVLRVQVESSALLAELDATTVNIAGLIANSS